jgi:hypothetical protein
MGMKQLTRIVTCFRQWSYIALWLDNPELYNENTDWIILNDEPNDHCPDELLRIALKRNVIIKNTEFNMGRSNQRNLGVHLSRTDWVEHIDGDDLPLPIESSLLSELSAFELAVFPVKCHRIKGSTIAEIDPESEKPYYGHFDDLGCLNHPPLDPRPASFLLKREAFLRIGGYDARFDGAEDRHLLFKADRARLALAKASAAKQSWLKTEDTKPESQFIPLARIRFLELLRDGYGPVLPPKVVALIEHYCIEQFWQLLGFVSGLPSGAISKHAPENIIPEHLRSLRNEVPAMLDSLGNYSVTKGPEGD